MIRYTQKTLQFIAEGCYKACGLDIFRDYRFLMSTFQWSSEKRTAYRLQKLNKIIEFAWLQVPFYREFWGDHGLVFNHLNHFEELEQYPILTKNIFKANSDKIKADNLKSIRHIKKWTGGTTGTPVQYLRDLRQWTFSEAFHLWGWSQIGYIFGDPVGVIAGGSLIPERMTFTSKARNLIHNRLFLYGVAMDESITQNFYHQLNRHGTKYIYGYPSVIYLFAKNLDKLKLSLPELKAVVCTAEMLLPQYRFGIEKYMGIPVFDNLGGNDGGYEAYECSQHKGLHYNDLQSLLEINTNDALKTGSLIITNFWNKSCPFIRYENGDIVSLSNEQCICGCPFPMISSIDGRTADILTFANGTSLSGPALTLIFGEMKIDGWQVVQKSAYSLEVRICSSSELKTEYLQHINTILRKYLSKEIEIFIKRVDHLEVTMAGKRKPIWSEVV